MRGAAASTIRGVTPESLVEILSRHVPADGKEARDRDFILAFVRSGGPLFDRGRYAPGHLTGSAFIVDGSPAFDRILLVHHTKLDRWLQPGGHGEDGETDPFDVALREAREETGISSLDPRNPLPRSRDPEPGARGPGFRALGSGSWVRPFPFDLDVHVIPARKSEPEHRHLDIRYLFVAPPDAVPVAGEESGEIRWFPLDPENPAFDASLRRAAKKILALR